MCSKNVSQQEKPGTTKTEGFALVATMLIAAVISVAMIPLLDLVGTSDESNVKLQVESFLNVEARENLELAVYLTKYIGGVPPFIKRHMMLNPCN